MRMLFVVCSLFVCMALAMANLVWHLHKRDVSATDFVQASITLISYVGVSYFWYTTM